MVGLVERLYLEIIGNSTSGVRALNSVGGAAVDSGKKFDGMAAKLAAIGTIAVPVAVTAAAAIALVVKSAMDEQQSIDKLNQTLSKNVYMHGQQLVAAQAWITKMQNATGIADDKLRPAMSNLIVAGMGWKKAQDTMRTAMDISVAKGLDLETVTKALAKAYQGNTASLSKLGIATKDASGNTLSFDGVMKNAANTMGGAAAKHAETAAGKFEIFRLKMQDLIEDIGMKLIPVMSDMATELGKAVDWLQAHKEDFKTFFEDVEKVVTRVWKAVEPIYRAFWEQLQNIFNLIDDLINGRWDEIWGDALRIIEGAWNDIKAPFEGAYAFFKDQFDAVGRAIGDAYNATIGPAINWIVGAFNDIIAAAKEAARVIDDLIGGGSFDRDVDAARKKMDAATRLGNGGGFTAPGPYGAAGAIVNRPTFALIGEAGPEAVIPLNQTRGNSPLPDGGGATGGDVYLDGTLVGTWMRNLALKDQRAGRAWTR